MHKRTNVNAQAYRSLLDTFLVHFLFNNVLQLQRRNKTLIACSQLLQMGANGTESSESDFAALQFSHHLYDIITSEINFGNHQLENKRHRFLPI